MIDTVERKLQNEDIEREIEKRQGKMHIIIKTEKERKKERDRARIRLLYCVDSFMILEDVIWLGFMVVVVDAGW